LPRLPTLRAQALRAGPNVKNKLTKILKKQGIILAKKEYDLDLLIFLLTAKGIVKIKAKSILKPKAKLRSIAETFDFVSFELIQGKNQFVLVGGKLIRRPMFLRKNLEKTLLLKAIAEITLAIVRDLETKKIYLLWLYILRALKNLKEKNLLAFLSFCLIHLVAIEGLINPYSARGGSASGRKEKDLIKELYTVPFSILQKKSYRDDDYKKIILNLRESLASERKQFKTIDLFLKNIN